MKIILSRSRLPVSYLIRWMTNSEWSHSAIIDDDWVIEATYPRVRVVTLEDFLAKHKDTMVIEIAVPDEWRALQFAYEQVGKPYDLDILKGWLFNRDWQDPSAWDCSELIAGSIYAGDRALFREGTIHHVSPQNLLMVPPNLAN